MTGRRRLLTYVAAAGLLSCSPALAAQERPAAKELHYGLYAHGLRAYSLDISYRLPSDSYYLKVHATTAGLVGIFLKTDVTAVATGALGPLGVSPVEYHSEGYSRKKQRQLTLRYVKGKDPRVVVLSPPEPDREEVLPSQTEHALDLLSAVAMVMQKLHKTGKCDSQIRIFDGLRLMDVTTFTAGAAGENERTYFFDPDKPALRCDFYGHQIGGFIRGGHKALLQKEQRGHIWFQDIPGTGLVPVRLEMDHPKQGHISIRMQES